jgi:long-chain fatty acid transport protein
MKRLFVFVCVSALVLAVASPMMAGGIDNKHNFSAEYIRTLNRNAATDSADAVVYNPAGVVKMEDGFFVNLSGQYAIKDYSNTIAGTEYDSDKDDFVPGLFVLYNQDKWAAYAAFTIPAGGGSVDYEDGNATTLAAGQGFMAGANYMLTLPAPIGMGLPAGNYYNTIQDQSLEGESFYYGFTVGGAYEVNDMLSVSLGARYIDAYRKADASVTIGDVTGTFPDQTADIEYEETADGWGGIIGLNITPAEKWNIGIRYETKTSLDFETDVDQDDLGILTDGEESSRDLPALLGLGVSHQCTPKLKSHVNFTYYFNENADWDGAEDDVDNGYDVGLAVEYAFTPEFMASVGYMYTDVGIDPDDMSFEAPELDAHTIAGGVAYEAMPGLNLNFGILKTFYQDETTSSGVKLEKDVIILAIGVQYKFW